MDKHTISALKLFFSILLSSNFIFAQHIDNLNSSNCEQYLSTNTNFCNDTLLICKKSFLKDKDWRWYVFTLNKLTENYYHKEEIIEALKVADSAYVFSEKHLNETDTIFLEAIHNRALFYEFWLNFNKAISIYKKVITIDNKISNPETAVTYNGLGHVYLRTKDYEKAVQYFQKSIDLHPDIKGINGPLAIRDLAFAQKLRGNVKLAIINYQKCLDLIKSNLAKEEIYLKRVEFLCYAEIAEIYLKTKESSNFNLYTKKAFKIYQTFGNQLFDDYKLYQLPGNLAFNQGNYESALSYFKKAEEAIIKDKKGFAKSTELAQIRAFVGNTHLKLNKYEKAFATYQSALDAVCNNFSFKSVEENPSIDQFYSKRAGIEILSYKANALTENYKQNKQVDQLKSAHKTYQLISTLIPLTRRDYVEVNSKFQLANETHAIYEKAIANCFELYAKTKDKQYLKDAFDFAESSKAIVLQEMMQANLAIGGLEDTLQQKDLDFKSEIAYYEQLINTTSKNEASKEKLKRWRSGLFDIKEAYEDFKTQLEKEKPDFYALKYANQLATVANIQYNLDEQTALIEYFSGSDHIYIFKIEKNNFEGFKVNKTNNLQQDITALQKLVGNRPKSGDYDSFRHTSNNIYNEILDLPLQSLSKSVDVDQLIIIPDDALCSIPFDVLLLNTKEENVEAIHHPKNLSYLFEDYALNYNYSASLFLRSIDQYDVGHSNDYAGFAPYFKDLSYNQKEVENINVLFENTIFIGNDANFENFKAQANQAKIVHLATHAQKNSKHHMLNEIQFADTALNNYQIENLQINAALAVLSACETGTGNLQIGEGLMSLSRSFFLAGCPSLISGLWRANDKSTADVMLYFYQHLEDGYSKDVALQKAKLQYCKEAGIRESHPFYWAGFLQFGNGKALF